MLSKMLRFKGLIIFLGLQLLCIAGWGQSYLEREEQWVQSRLGRMSLEEKIGQLLMIRAYSRGDKAEEKLILKYIRQYHIGGICFFQGSPAEQARLVNVYQAASQVPLFIGIDAEWGLGQRFPKEAISFPKQMALGAIQDSRHIYDMGKEIAAQLKAVGVNVNFAPAVDINNNPANPVIHERSFGEDRFNVTSKAYMYIKALEDNGVLACIKHFPGHGDTDKDSHFELPVIPHKTDRLDEVELYPFRRLMHQTQTAIMTAHLHMPEFDNRPGRPASLSHTIVIELLRETLGFGGLIFSDALDMKAVTHHFADDVAPAEAFLAGNDILLLPKDIKKAIDGIKKYIDEGLITEERLNASVIRILRNKYKLGLTHTPSVNPEMVKEILQSPAAMAKQLALIENSLTIVADKDNRIPVVDLADRRFATLSVNVAVKSPFQQRIDDFVDARHYQLMVEELPVRKSSLLNTLSQFDEIIVAIHTSGKISLSKKEVPEDLALFLKQLASVKPVIVLLFGSPYLLPQLEGIPALMLCYSNDKAVQDVAAQSLFGVNALSGKLPVTASRMYTIETGIYRGSLGRLGFGIPEQVNVNGKVLEEIDELINEMLRDNVTPGGQIVVAKDGKIIYEKNFGKLSPAGTAVGSGTIYDIASVTKILATTLSVMALSDQKKIDIQKPLKRYISGIEHTNKKDLILADILAHHGRLASWIPFYESTLSSSKDKSVYNPIYYSYQMKDNYTIPVANRMFMRTDYRDSVWQKIWDSNLRATDTYLYSDLGFYILQQCVESASGKKLNEYADRLFYKPLGLRYTGYLPLEKHPAKNIAPTEVDNYWRKQTIQGHVHDMGAAMMGGVSGHAGLFSTAREMSILMQLLLNKGSYGGVRYFRPETVELFTTRYFKSTRRGLGFDMKETDQRKKLNMAEMAPVSTFGHLGFTGTAAFADPENNIIFIFVSNCTYTGKNLLNTRDYRSRIHNIIYKALGKSGVLIT